MSTHTNTSEYHSIQDGVGTSPIRSDAIPKVTGGMQDQAPLGTESGLAVP